MSRIRNVWPREQVAHLWANASQDQARDPSGNMYFSGPTLYSYGSHYVIGYRLAHNLFVMNADTNSPTTNKMRCIAARAVPGYARELWVGGLSQNDFYGQKWRGALVRKALAQAGRLYAQAAKVSRVSMKRDGLCAEAHARVDAARRLAQYFIGEKQEAPDMRAALRTLAKADAIAWPDANAERKAQNAGEIAACEKLAALLSRDELRREFSDLIRASLQLFDNAGSGRRFDVRDRDNNNAEARANEARTLAKTYGFRMPKMPDFAAMRAELAPHVRAQRLAELQKEGRTYLEDAEGNARAMRNDGDSYSNGYVIRAVQCVRNAEKNLRELGEALPAWIMERANALGAKAARRARANVSENDIARISSSFGEGDNMAGKGFHRDAAKAYASAVRLLESCRNALADMPTHPQAVKLAAFEPQRLAAVDYLATAEARIREENAENIAAWRRGDRRTFDTAHSLPPMLRVNGSNIETSHGAIVPVSAAPRLWRLIERTKGTDTGASFTGLHVGQFTLHELRPNGDAVVGCHTLEYAEMRACAVALGLEVSP